MRPFEQNYSQFLQIPVERKVCILKMLESSMNHRCKEKFKAQLY